MMAAVMGRGARAPGARRNDVRIMRARAYLGTFIAKIERLRRSLCLRKRWRGPEGRLCNSGDDVERIPAGRRLG